MQKPQLMSCLCDGSVYLVQLKRAAARYLLLKPLVPAGIVIYSNLSRCLQSTFHCSGWDLKRKRVRLFFQGSTIHDPPNIKQTACAAFPAADIIRVGKTPQGFSPFFFSFSFVDFS